MERRIGFEAATKRPSGWLPTTFDHKTSPKVVTALWRNLPPEAFVPQPTSMASINHFLWNLESPLSVACSTMPKPSARPSTPSRTSGSTMAPNRPLPQPVRSPLQSTRFYPTSESVNKMRSSGSASDLKRDGCSTAPPSRPSPADREKTFRRIPTTDSLPELLKPDGSLHRDPPSGRGSPHGIYLRSTLRTTPAESELPAQAPAVEEWLAVTKQSIRSDSSVSPSPCKSTTGPATDCMERAAKAKARMEQARVVIELATSVNTQTGRRSRCAEPPDYHELHKMLLSILNVDDL